MKTKLCLVLLILTPFWISFARALPLKTWTDNTGNFRVQAELVDFDDQVARLKRAGDGKMLRVPIDRLSEADRQHLQSLGTPDDYRVIGELCQEIRRTWLKEPSVDTAWVGHFILHFVDPVSGEPKSLGWDELVRGVSTLQQAVPSSDPPQWQVRGAVALVHLKLGQLQTKDGWIDADSLLVAVRRQGKWRITAGVLGDWRLGPGNAYDPGNQGHIAIRAVYDQVDRGRVQKDLDLLAGMLHPSHCHVTSDPTDPEKARVIDRQQIVQVYQAWLQNMTPKPFEVKIRHVKIQGPLALAIGEVQPVSEDGDLRHAAATDLFCRTAEGWKFCLGVSGDWEKLLLGDRAGETGPPESPPVDPTTSDWQEPDWRTSGEEQVSLKFEFAPDERIHYRQATTQQQAMTSAVTTLQVESLSEDGKVRVHVENRGQTLNMGGKDLRHQVPSWGRFTIDNRGKMENCQGLVGLRSLPAFPGDSVKLGQAWSAPAVLGNDVGPSAPKIPADVNYRLTGLAEVKGHTWARIEFDSALELPEGPYTLKRIGTSVATVAHRRSRFVVATGVLPGSAAEEAGMLDGDVFVELAGMPIRTYGDLICALHAPAADPAMNVVVLRDGKRKELAMTPHATESGNLGIQGQLRGTLVFDATAGKLIRLTAQVDMRVAMDRDGQRLEQEGTASIWIQRIEPTAADVPLDVGVGEIEAIVDKINRAWAVEDGTALFGEILSDRAFAVPFVSPRQPVEVVVLDKEAFLSNQIKVRQGPDYRGHRHRADFITVVGPLAYELGTSRHSTADGAENATKLMNFYARDTRDASGWRLISSLPAELLVNAFAAPENAAVPTDPQAVAAIRQGIEQFNAAWQADGGMEPLGELLSGSAFVWVDSASDGTQVLDREATLALFRQIVAEGGKLHYRLEKLVAAGPLACAIGSAERRSADGQPGESVETMLVFARGPAGWKAVFVTPCQSIRWALPGPEDRPAPSDPPEVRTDREAIEQLCQRVRRIWQQRQYPDPIDTLWPESFVLFGSQPQSPYAMVVPWKTEGENENLAWKLADEIVAVDDSPVIQIQGPLAIMRSRTARCRVAQQWVPIEGLEFLIRRDGHWRTAAAVAGDWEFDADDRFDADNKDHQEIRTLLDQGVRATTEGDWKQFRDLLHPHMRAMGPDPANPQNAVALNVDQALAEAAGAAPSTPPGVARPQPTRKIVCLKVNGPIAVAIIELEMVVGGTPRTGGTMLGVLLRTAEGWRVGLRVPGDWREVLLGGDGA